MPRDDTANPLVVYRQTRQRIVVSLVVLLVVSAIGATGYWYLGWVDEATYWTFRECLYMTAITITTVGFNETLDLDAVSGARTWTLLLLLFGISANLYAVSSITSFFVESDFANVRRYRRLLKRMANIRDHYIVCGAGRTGVHVVGELQSVGGEIVVIDQDRELLAELEDQDVLCIVGDATDDEVLEKAGLSRAKGIIAALDDDKTNMFVVVSARQANPHLRIVTKAVSPTAAEKLRRAGADAVVSPAFIGGMRIASEMLRPQVVRFLDEMLRDREANLRIEEANVGEGGPAVGKKLRDGKIRERTGALIIAVRAADGSTTHIPNADLEIHPGQTLVAIGTPDDIDRLREAVAHEPVMREAHPAGLSYSSRPDGRRPDA